MPISSARSCPRQWWRRSSASGTNTARRKRASDMAAWAQAWSIAVAARRAENGLAAAALALMALLPALEPLLRTLFAVGIPGNTGYVENLTLWVAYLGA